MRLSVRLLPLFVPVLVALSARSQEVQFAAPIVFASAGSYPAGIAAGDFNNDGIPDLIVGDEALSEAEVALGNGDGTFGGWNTGCGDGAPANVVAVGRFDGKNLGALVNDTERSYGTLCLGDGTGNFSGGDLFTVNGETTVTGFASADFNKDGNEDLVLVSAGQNWPVGEIAVYLGNGDGTFQNPMSLTRRAGPVAVSTGDFNGDGNPDIAVLTQDFGDFGGYVAVFLGDGKGSFGRPTLFRLPKNHGALGFSPLSGMAVGDFDGDGRLDVAVAVSDGSSNQTSYVGILLGNGDGSFRMGQLAPAGPDPVSIAAADFNGDLVLDLVTANFGCVDPINHGGCVGILIGNGDGTFQKPSLFKVSGNAPWPLTVADFNGDGKPDVATANGDSGSITVLLNTTQFPTEKR
jgi:hypothetical protein